jgi:hypothetical protein
MLPVHDAGQHHEDERRQADTQERNGSAERSGEPVARQNCHVGGVEAGQGVADRGDLQKLDVVEPFLLADERVTKISDDASAEANGADI